MCLQLSTSECVHLVAVFNQMVKGCVHLKVFALKLQGNDHDQFLCQMYTSVYSVLEITVCNVLQKA